MGAALKTLERRGLMERRAKALGKRNMHKGFDCSAVRVTWAHKHPLGYSDKAIEQYGLLDMIENDCVLSGISWSRGAGFWANSIEEPPHKATASEIAKLVRRACEVAEFRPDGDVAEFLRKYPELIQ